MAARGSQGSAAVEFALVLPVLLTVLFAILKFGVALNNDIQLTDGVRIAARQFAVGRSTTTPYTSASTALQNATPGLTFSAEKPVFAVNGVACNSDSTCITALAKDEGGPSSVTATYSCDLTVLGVDFAPSCVLTASTTELVE